MGHRQFPAEFVFPGHPDKLCDAIADALVADAIRREPRALVGVEVAAHRNKVFVTGRIACHDAKAIDVDAIVGDVYRSAGYGDGWYPAPEDLEIEAVLCLGPLEEGEAEFRELSDDQAICIGYAVDIPETNYLPVEHWLARKLAQRLYRLRGDHPGLSLGPDGKVLVTVRQEKENHWALDGFSCSLQQRVPADDIALHRAVRLAVEEELAGLAEALPGLSPKPPQRLTVNGAGAFEVGGPEGDNGLSGKKLVMDAYGPRVPIGGGAWSGKDFFKADRAGGIHARRLAKLIVELGIVPEATVVLGWFPGDREAPTPEHGCATVLFRVHREGCQRVDLSLAASGNSFGRGVDLLEIARFGHFHDTELPWESLGRL